MNSPDITRRLQAGLGLAILLLALPNFAFAQEGVSSMSMGAARSGVASYSADGRYLMPVPDLIRIEEFINYHRHDIPLPTDGKRVNLDVQAMQLDSGKTVMQFGLTTPRDLDPELVPPLNLVLVIDQSGSMQGDRIANVKLALNSFVDRLRKQDKVCIVGFNNEASVVLEATEKTKTKKIKRAIDKLVAGGSTNLHAGLMLGYQQATMSYDKERTNRVILLSDGITNTGVTNLQQIASESKSFNQEGIDLSTIGLGQNLNHQLLRDLADAGRGLIHFVGDAQDIHKTFVAEVESLLAPAARKVRLSIDFGKHAERVKFYGYEPERNGSVFTFKLDDLNHGATQVVMARLPKSAKGNVDGITATLKYKDAINGDSVNLQSAAGDATPGRNSSINKNYAIALVAKSIKKACVDSHDSDCRGAEERLQKGIRSARKVLNYRSDEDIERMVDIAKDYRQNLLNSMENRRGRD